MRSSDVPNGRLDEKLEEGKTIIQALGKLKYQMGRDRPLE